ncbi:hypothetical protein [Flavilitoribacter nigricans]|uniref:Uncharacterized protein n=1 Tax=Flavilitoribacter nigricans (strain ATCC 23147 / DSM 23189 / NBRC 102662 / NCIMB 1420 / SS-2) TaxID=1122177 RepID=A0A2D0N6J8_FLAN2|nr:hypothetical protein [Flavilitoribacter nigricans]PHN04006.1 hypothetical protein CRP01_24360 [Flavilitoribacter nigricans DSM 23189 = NBRC 102662]
MGEWKETQLFMNRMLSLILGVPLIAAFFIAIFYKNSPGLTIVIGSLVFVVLLMGSLKMTVRINRQGVFFKYVPFHFSEQFIPWEKISEWELINVNALMDFGGIGIRYSRTKKGFIINSKSGLEIRKTDKRIIVLSVNDTQGAEAVLRGFGGNDPDVN